MSVEALEHLRGEMEGADYAVFRTLVVAQQRVYGFHTMPEKGNLIIDLAPEILNGEVIGKTERLEGTLVDSKKGLMRVRNARPEFNLRDKLIGLAAYVTLMTRGVEVGPIDLRTCASPANLFSYYFTHDVKPDSPYGIPDEYHHLPFVYGRVACDDLVLFDVLS